jgi:hypothetical protein
VGKCTGRVSCVKHRRHRHTHLCRAFVIVIMRCLERAANRRLETFKSSKLALTLHVRAAHKLCRKEIVAPTSAFNVVHKMWVHELQIALVSVVDDCVAGVVSLLSKDDERVDGRLEAETSH